MLQNTFWEEYMKNKSKLWNKFRLEDNLFEENNFKNLINLDVLKVLQSEQILIHITSIFIIYITVLLIYTPVKNHLSLSIQHYIAKFIDPPFIFKTHTN